MYCAAVLLLLVNVFARNVAGVIVETEQGQLRGEYLQAVTGDFHYASFKGIPFAKPPLGDLRFMAPQPPESWCGIRNATQHGSTCVQISIYNFIDISGSEDCLYLNVYTPNVKPKNLLPVMFFIHGGGFQSGSGDSDRYGPDYLMAQNVVLVTSNHRLGALGFLCLNTADVPGNAGMKDQVAALKWVQKNIANFGGNPDAVTIFGQSTGGASVAFHNLSPMSEGLYIRGVAMSGSALNDYAVPFEPRRIAFRLGQQLGHWTRDDQKLLTFLKSVPAEQFFGKNPAVLRSEDPRISLKQLIFIPVVETDFGQERFLTTSPIDALNCGKVHNVDLFIGRTAIEGIIQFIFGKASVPAQYTNYTEMLLPRGILEITPPAKMFPLADMVHEKYFGCKEVNDDSGLEFIQYLSDASFNYAITKYARLFSLYRNTYMYKFSKKPDFPRYTTIQNEFGTEEAIHEDDLSYLFNPGNMTIDATTDDYKIMQATCALYANFAKYGNPTPNNRLGVKLPKYNSRTGYYYVNIDKKLTIEQNLDEDAVSFWDSIYRASGLPY